MITYLLVAARARLDIIDAEGKTAIEYARENKNTITEQVVMLASQGKLEEDVPNDIQLFLETFGYVERLDFLNDLRSISQHMSDSLNFVTDDLTSADSTTDYDVTDDQLSDANTRSRHHSFSKDK